MREFEKTTQEWIKETSTSEEEGEGKKTGVLLQEKRAELTHRLRAGYWQLDPYLRAKTLYDRLGVIGEGGKVDFYDAAASASASPNDQKKEAVNNPTPTSANATNTAAGHRDHDLD